MTTKHTIEGALSASYLRDSLTIEAMQHLRAHLTAMLEEARQEAARECTSLCEAELRHAYDGPDKTGRDIGVADGSRYCADAIREHFKLEKT